MNNTLGIMVHQIKETNRFQRLLATAMEEGFTGAVLFTPADVDLKALRIHGFVYRNGVWTREWHPFPPISYDIGYYTQRESVQLVKKVKSHPKLPFINYGLGNKWTIHQKLIAAPPLRPHLLPTARAENRETILAMVKKYGSVMIKPFNGKGGKGIIRLSIVPTGYALEKNRSTIRYYSASGIEEPLQQLLTQGKYIVQKWIDIRDKKGLVYDIRVLMQKNRLGQWQLTGMGIRQGIEDKITSNLTGGGQAFPVYPFLKEQFGEKTAKELLSTIRQISEYIPPYLETAYRKRLAELGLDLAVDRHGQIWLIEVNIKPGKTLWRKISDRETDQVSWRAPIQYARYLLETGKKG